MTLQEKRDPLEYAPQFKAAFLAATAEANSNIVARTRGGFFDSQSLRDQEIQRVLKKRFHLEWRTPQDIREAQY